LFSHHPLLLEVVLAQHHLAKNHPLVPVVLVVLLELSSLVENSVVLNHRSHPVAMKALNKVELVCILSRSLFDLSFSIY
jgi:hypothetical protein